MHRHIHYHTALIPAPEYFLNTCQKPTLTQTYTYKCICRDSHTHTHRHTHTHTQSCRKGQSPYFRYDSPVSQWVCLLSCGNQKIVISNQMCVRTHSHTLTHTHTPHTHKHTHTT